MVGCDGWNTLGFIKGILLALREKKIPDLNPRGPDHISAEGGDHRMTVVNHTHDTLNICHFFPARFSITATVLSVAPGCQWTDGVLWCLMSRLRWQDCHSSLLHRRIKLWLYCTLHKAEFLFNETDCVQSEFNEREQPLAVTNVIQTEETCISGLRGRLLAASPSIMSWGSHHLSLLI